MSQLLGHVGVEQVNHPSMNMVLRLLQTVLDSAAGSTAHALQILMNSLCKKFVSRPGLVHRYVLEEPFRLHSVPAHRNLPSTTVVARVAFVEFPHAGVSKLSLSNIQVEPELSEQPWKTTQLLPQVTLRCSDHAGLEHLRLAQSLGPLSHCE